MHFVLSHTRSKSRSPAPSSPSVLSQYNRPPTFLPPSHYAAAAGLEPRLSDAQHSPHRSTLQHSAQGPPGEPAGSHFGAMGRLMGRAPGKRSPAISASPESRVDQDQDLRERRKSQLGNLPLLETQLLPSLRDTVDRMTQHSPIKPDTAESLETHDARFPRHRKRREEILPSPSASSSIAPKTLGHWDSVPSTGIPRFNPLPAPHPVLKSPGSRAPANVTSGSSQRARNIRFQESESNHELLSGSETGVSLSDIYWDTSELTSV